MVRAFRRNVYSIAPSIESKIVRLLANGALDTAFSPRIASYQDGGYSHIASILTQADGKFVIAGRFLVEGFPGQGNLARLNPDGSLDSTFVRKAIPAEEFRTVAIRQQDEKIIVASVGFISASLSRLNPDGSIDESFDVGTGTNGQINQMLFQPDGKLLITGIFSEISGIPRRNIARLNVRPPFVFSPPAIRNGVVNLALTTEPGKSYILQTSTNLTSWLSVQTNTATSFSLEIGYPKEAPLRFYRAVMVP